MIWVCNKTKMTCPQIALAPCIYLYYIFEFEDLNYIINVFSGSLYHYTNSYDGSFLLAGFMIAISGMMLFFIPCIWKIQAKKIAKKCTTDNNQL